MRHLFCKNKIQSGGVLQSVIIRRRTRWGSAGQAGRQPILRDAREGGLHEIPGRDASTSFAFGRRRLTSRLNSRAALSPRMLRLACSERNGKVVIEDGGSKSQCGQSEANRSCVSALIASMVH